MKLFAMMFSLVVLVLMTGCVTVADDIPLYLETPPDPSDGRVYVVEDVTKTKTFIVNEEVIDKTVDQTTTKLSPAMAELKLKLAKIEAEKALAEAALRAMGGGVTVGSGMPFTYGVYRSY